MLEARGIHKVYNNGKKELEVLRGINLSIEQGRFISIVGPSGAGKSTLLHILGGLDNPTKGSVIFKEKNIYALSDNALSEIRNKKIGFVFQFYHLLSEFTVLENVLMPALIGSGARKRDTQARGKAIELLEKAGLKKRMAHFPSQLSGGEQQRVAIARALINSPEILLCDEPTGNLDSNTGNEIFGLIRKINSENRMTVVLVTHNLELAKLSDKVYHLEDGVLS
jgi:lipoprotein releasing system ATP-binding protein